MVLYCDDAGSDRREMRLARIFWHRFSSSLLQMPKLRLITIPTGISTLSDSSVIGVFWLRTVTSIALDLQKSECKHDVMPSSLPLSFFKNNLLELS